MDIRLIFSDIDRTILPAKGNISPATAKAVADCRARGVEFVVASGRWYPAAKLISEGQLGVRDGYMIICNGGAVVRSDGSPLMEWGMSDAEVKAVYDILWPEKVMMTAYVRNAIFRLRGEYLTVFSLPEVGFFSENAAYEVVDGDHARFVSEGMRHPYKMEAYSDDFALLARLREKLSAAGLQVNSSFPCNLEIMGSGMGKGAAVRWLTQHLGFSAEQTMGFGDYTNDIPMLENVGWPVAVDNACDEVKKICRMVAPACDDDGVAKFIGKYILGDEKT
ncbi:MAG: HAD family phosphatase [Clostridia bacterium]|nr:HAD family phosphatase [Clostridia bacterium]